MPTFPASLVCRRLSCLAAISAFLVPLAYALCWLLPGQLLAVNTLYAGEFAFGALDGAQRLFAAAAAMLPAACLSYAFWQLHRLMDVYARGMLFDASAPSRLRRAGLSLLAWVAASRLAEIATTYFLSSHLPLAQRTIRIAFGGEDLLALVFGGAACGLSWVLREANRVHDDHQLIV